MKAVEWIALGVIAIAAAALVTNPGTRRVAVLDPRAQLEVERLPSGRAAVRLDDIAWQAACEAAGVPGPASLDGADPVPVAILLDQFERWTRDRDVAALGRLGRIYQALEEHEPALECFAAAAALEPDDPVWPYLVGSEAQALGHVDLALAALERARDAEPTYALTHARLALLELEQGDLDRAEADYGRYVEAHPGRSLGHVGLARVALARGDAADAERHLHRAIAATPNDFLAHRFLARALQAQGRGAEARAASRRAERLPQYSSWLVFDERLEASHALANTQRSLENGMRVAQGAGDRATVVRLAEALLRRRPDDESTLGALASTHLRAGRVDEARATVDRAIAIRPESPAVLCLRAQVEIAAGASDVARAAIERAQAIDPQYAPAFDIEGRLLFASGRTEEAIWCMRQALALDADRDDTRLILATMLERSRRFQAAARELRTIVEHAPDPVEARRRLEALEARGVR